MPPTTFFKRRKYRYVAMQNFLKLLTLAAGCAAVAGHAQTSSPTADSTAVGVVAEPGIRTAVYPLTEGKKRAREWFQDTKIGVYFHWGIYSQLGGVGGAAAGEWAMSALKIPASKYERLAQFFNPTGFDADEWVKAAKDAGAGYIIFTSKHHDGFAMWDSKVSNYDIVDATPFKRDVIKELAEACRRQGIKLFLYHSELDWHHPDYFPRGRTGGSSGRPDSGNWERYLDYQNAQVRELLTNYGPIGGVWFDGWWDKPEKPGQDIWRLDRKYRLIHQLQPNTLIANNHHVEPFPGEDYQAFERDLPGENTMGFNTKAIGRLPLEMAQTVNSSWGFSLVDTNFKSDERIVRDLVGAAGRNANFVLNTGPMPNGKIQPESLATFAAMGKWLKQNGRSIYKTRGGPIGPQPWGVTTQRGKTVYVHILDWTQDALTLPLDQAVAGARLLSSGQPIGVTQANGKVTLTGAAKQPGEWDRIVELTLQ